MSDEPNRTDPVSFDKKSAGAGPAGARPGRRGGPNLAADGTPMPPPPQPVRYATLVLFLAGLFSLGAAAAVYGNKSWLTRNLTDNNPKPGKKGHLDAKALQQAIDRAPSSGLLMSAVLLLALSFVARGVWRGRSWSRWTVIGLWVIASFLGVSYAGLNSLVSLGSSTPAAIKIPAAISALLMIAAVVLVSLRPSQAYFALTKPVRPGGAAGGPARGGLFGPRPQRTAGRTQPVTERREASTRPATDRSRAKQRAATESVAKGAELARARAKASKSRRTGV